MVFSFFQIIVRLRVTYLSIIVIIGAADPAAEAALKASAPNLNPRFLVFHFGGIATAFAVLVEMRAEWLGSAAEIGGFTLGNSFTISSVIGDSRRY
jgi:hypothetical protein